MLAILYILVQLPYTLLCFRNVFATAAFRFGHTLIGQKFSRRDIRGQSRGTSDLSAVFDAVAMVNAHGADSMTRGLIGDNAEAWDRFCARGVSPSNVAVHFLLRIRFFFQIRENLFNSPIDLFSLNINRGRDHGLPSYQQFRRVLRLDTARDFEELDFTHSEETIDSLKSIYPHVEDIEMWPGGEKPVELNSERQSQKHIYFIRFV